jgi:tyrosyl-tRNA synthetase
MFQYHVFPRVSSVTMNRPEKFGGNREFTTYQELEDAYRKGEIHPLDLKKTLGCYLSEILAQVRDYVL